MSLSEDSSLLQKSFLNARDRSIITWRWAKNPKVLQYTEGPQATEEDELIKVYLRIKSKAELSKCYTVDGCNVICNVPESSQAHRNNRDACKVIKYKFSKIFDSSHSQTDVFNSFVKEKVLHFINGSSCTLMSYGASGSGKTFTIFGNASSPGVLPRALDYLFRTIPVINDVPNIKPVASDGSCIVLDDDSKLAEVNKRNLILEYFAQTTERHMHAKTFSAMQARLSAEQPGHVEPACETSVAVYVSFCEIYNEFVYDLLSTSKERTKLKLGKDLEGYSYIKDLAAVSVCSSLQAYEVLQFGLHNLHYESTKVNLRSSRSHSIFTVRLVQFNDPSRQGCSSTFSFCDLAGSERLKNTSNVGDRLRESNNINTSLHVLGRCIKSIRDKQMKNDSTIMPPYRDSKLTMVFQRAFSSLESIALMVNISDNVEMFDESMNVLNFSAIARTIQLEPITKSCGLSGEASQIQALSSKENALQLKISQLMEENRVLREQVKTAGIKVRQEVASEAGKLLSEKTVMWRKRLEDLEEKHRAEIAEILEEHEKQLRNLKSGIEDEQPLRKRKRMHDHSAIIVIDDSIDDISLVNLEKTGENDHQHTEGSDNYLKKRKIEEEVPSLNSLVETEDQNSL